MDKIDKVESIDETIENWVKLYTNTLYKWAFFKTSEKETAEDLVQETFLAAHLQFEKFKGDSSPKTWLLAILNNKIKGFYRAKYKMLSANGSGAFEDDSIFDQLFDKNDRWKKEERPSFWKEDDLHLLDDPNFNHVLSSCLEYLPKQWMLAINFKYIEQKKGEIICQELDISPTNFWQILHRAKLQLRKCLDTKWFKA